MSVLDEIKSLGKYRPDYQLVLSLRLPV